MMKHNLILTISGAVTNFALSLVKLFIGIVSNSITIFFDAINNMLDVAGNALGAVGIRYSAKGPNNRYPSGYSRAENVTSLVISLGTLVFGFLFVFYSVERLIFPLPVYFAWLYFGLLLFTVAVKVVMGVCYYMAYKRDSSDITRALYIDSFMDASITGCLVICYGVSQATNTIIDAIFGVILGAIIMLMTIRAIVDSVRKLMGYNARIDIDGLRDRLIESGIFISIDSITIESDDRVLVVGKYMIERVGELREISRELGVPIIIGEEISYNGQGE